MRQAAASGVVVLNLVGVGCATLDGALWLLDAGGNASKASADVFATAAGNIAASAVT